ncbi:MAG TPA: hypothetical protein DEB31_07635 [Clostridiales bacterium]|nr:hypothetical protein [Clostridiales bacterium]
MAKPLEQMTNEELWQLFPIVLREHDPTWAELFSRERGLLAQAVGAENIAAVSHIGSTAVPGLIAKPTIDILLEITDGADTQKLKTDMVGAGYLFSPQPEKPAPHMMFLKGYTPAGFAGQAFHVHVRYAGDWDEKIFCAYLQTHAQAAREYGLLKRRLQKEFEHDRDGYTREKTDFIRGILKQAGR